MGRTFSFVITHGYEDAGATGASRASNRQRGENLDSRSVSNGVKGRRAEQRALDNDHVAVGETAKASGDMVAE